MEGFGCGCAFLDFDSDGYQDILLVAEPVARLFRNESGTAFTDVTDSAGLSRVTGAWKGCAVADYDGDGWLDILLTGYRRLALLRNQSGRSFQDATQTARLDRTNWGNWGASAGFMDLDQDGDLDLAMQNYVSWNPGMIQQCKYGKLSVACPPEVHDAEHARLIRNHGDGTFRDISRESGLDRTHGYGMVIGFADANDDGKTDFYLGNDGVDADFMQNLGGMKFRNVALENGAAAARSGNELAAMGVDWADYDRDGRLDFAVSGFSEESNALFRNDEGGLFQDTSAAVGIAMPTYLPLGFGTKFADVDNDGWLDLFFVNGHIFDRAAEAVSGATFRQPSMLFMNQAGQQFTDIGPTLGEAFTRPIVGRGSASGDYDNDGRVDLLAVDYEGEPLLLHNVSATKGHWVTLDLRGTGKNRHAHGARVTLRGGGVTWVAEVSPASSYLSSSDPRLHFGLGDVATVSLEVRWPTGVREEHPNVPVDRMSYLIFGRGLSDRNPSLGTVRN